MLHAPRSHDAIWVGQLAADLSARGHPGNTLLARVGIDPRISEAERSRIPFEKHAAFFELAAEVTGDDLLGLHFGQTRDTRDAGLIGYVGRSSATVADALKNLSRYRRVFSDAAEIDISRLEPDGVIRWWFHEADPGRSRQCVEFATANLLRAIRAETGERIAPVRIQFVHARSRHRGELSSYFDCPTSFGVAENLIELRSRDLALPLVNSDNRLLAILRNHCEDVLSRRPELPPSMIEAVERKVAERLPGGALRLGALASEMGMSERSLSRRLAEQGLSLTGIIDTLRKELALKYLRDERLSVTEIAFLLGYGETSTFNHAFKRWTGKTPTTFRRSAFA